MPVAQPNRGAELFAGWLAEQKMSQSQAASRFGVAKSYIGLLCNARATPGLAVAARIEAVTEGLVPCRAWTQPSAG